MARPSIPPPFRDFLSLAVRRASLLAENVAEHEVFVFGGSLAYTTGLALSPFLMILLSIVALLGADSEQALVDQMTGLLGRQAGEAMRTIAQSAQSKAHFSGVSGALSLLIVMVASSAIFSQLRQALDKVNGRTAPKESSGLWLLLREKVFSIGLVLAFIFLLMVSLSVTAGLALTFRGETGLVWTSVSFAVTFAVFSLLFTAMFHFIPSDRSSWRQSLVAGACATAFFLVGKTLIGIYLGTSAVASAYGAAGSLVVLLIWLYYTSVTLLISYEFTKVVVLRGNRP